MIRTTINLFLILILTSCNTKEVQLRVRNSSSFNYDSVKVNTGGGENTYGTIPAGNVSDYKTFDYAYSYAYIFLKIDTTSYILQPIDYVGEIKLKTGKYTYEVSVYDTVTHQLGLNLIED